VYETNLISLSCPGSISLVHVAAEGSFYLTVIAAYGPSPVQLMVYCSAVFISVNAIKLMSCGVLYFYYFIGLNVMMSAKPCRVQEFRRVDLHGINCASNKGATKIIRSHMIMVMVMG
jgi:hypothetical protein